MRTPLGTWIWHYKNWHAGGSLAVPPDRPAAMHPPELRDHVRAQPLHHAFERRYE